MSTKAPLATDTMINTVVHKYKKAIAQLHATDKVQEYVHWCISHGSDLMWAAAALNADPKTPACAKHKQAP